MAERATAAVLALALCACGASATEALVADGLPPAKAAPEGAERYTLSGATTVVEVDINGVVSYTLKFPDISGELFLAIQEPTRSVATLLVDTRTATTDNAELGRIAKSKDFLDVETHPQAKFEVRGLEKKPEANAYEMVGVLELHGTKKAITVPFTLHWDACRAVAASEFSVNRRQFGVASDTFLDGMASDDVDIRVRMQVPREKAPPHCPEGAGQGSVAR